MLPMILTILKFIIFTGLALLALFLVLLFFILAAPIHYQITGSWKHKLLIQGKVRWLYRILGISWEWRDGSPDMQISLFGHILGRNTASASDVASSSVLKVSNPAEVPKASKISQISKVSKTSPVSPHSQYSNTAKSVDRITSQESQTHLKSELVESEREENCFIELEKNEEDSSDFEWNDKDLLENLTKKEGKSSVWTKLQQIFDFLNQESVRKLLRKCWKRLAKFGKHLRPLQVLLQGRIGTDDPALTGKLMEAAAILYAFYGETIALTADFEEEALEIDFQIKGRVVPGYVLLTVLIIGLRIFRNQECRVLWKKLRQNELSA